MSDDFFWYSARVHTGLPALHRAYGALLQDLFGRTELADNLFARADNLEEERSTAGMHCLLCLLYRDFRGVSFPCSRFSKRTIIFSPYYPGPPFRVPPSPPLGSCLTADVVSDAASVTSSIVEGGSPADPAAAPASSAAGSLVRRHVGAGTAAGAGATGRRPSVGRAATTKGSLVGGTQNMGEASQKGSMTGASASLVTTAGGLELRSGLIASALGGAWGTCDARILYGNNGLTIARVHWEQNWPTANALDEAEAFRGLR